MLEPCSCLVIQILALLIILYENNALECAQYDTILNIMNQEQSDKFHDLYFELIAKQTQQEYEKKQIPRTKQKTLHQQTPSCSICFQLFSSIKDEIHCPMILNDCGHSFCLECVDKLHHWIKQYCCPIDQISSRKLLVNYQLISLIDDLKDGCKPIRSLEPKCDKHRNQELIFYDPNNEAFFCLTCLKTNDMHETKIKDYKFISYDKLKPKIMKRLEARVSAMPQRAKEIKSPIKIEKIEEQQKQLVKELEKIRDDIISKITEETNQKLKQIERTFKDEVYKQAIEIQEALFCQQLTKEMIQKQKCNKFLADFGKQVQRGFQSIYDEELDFRSFLFDVTDKYVKTDWAEDIVRLASNQVIKLHKYI